MTCGHGAKLSVRPKPPQSESSEVPSSGRAAAPREVYFELYPVGDSMKVSAVDSATGTEVSIVGPANLSKAELEHVALNKLRYVMKQKADREERSTAASKRQKDRNGWVV